MQTHHATFAEQAAYLARRLPPVILTTTDPTGRGRGQGSTRPLPSDLPSDLPPPRRAFSIIVARQPAGVRFLAFIGRTCPAKVEIHEARGIVGTLARLFADQGAIDTTAVEVVS